MNTIESAPTTESAAQSKHTKTLTKKRSGISRFIRRKLNAHEQLLQTMVARQAPKRKRLKPADLEAEFTELLGFAAAIADKTGHVVDAKNAYTILNLCARRYCDARQIRGKQRAWLLRRLIRFANTLKQELEQ